MAPLDISLRSIVEVRLHATLDNVIVVAASAADAGREAALLVLLVRGEDADEADALLAGLQVLSAAARAAERRALARVVRTLDRRVMWEMLLRWRRKVSGPVKATAYA